jgi:ribosomal protein S18 acetylase RimI-like enzyme
MSDEGAFDTQAIRRMQALAQEVAALRPELLNADATFGELAWIWGRGLPGDAESWPHHFWRHEGRVIGWGWVHPPYHGTRSDGTSYEAAEAYLAWQVHPAHPEILDEILDWYDDQAGQHERLISAQSADEPAQARIRAHGFRLDEKAAAEDGSWTQFNERALDEVDEPALPDGYRFLTAQDVSSEAAWRAHVDAWHPSKLTLAAMEGAQRTWPYRPDLHVLIEAPDGTLVASTIMWLDEQNRTAEFEPVGTHRDYRRRGLGQALLRHGMDRARLAGATRMLVACLGGAAHPAAKGLYYSVGFREFTRDVPYRKGD